MSINHSSASCDWCRKKIDDGADVACGKCQQDVESENSDLKAEVATLKAKIDDLEGEVADLKGEIKAYEGFKP